MLDTPIADNVTRQEKISRTNDMYWTLTLHSLSRTMPKTKLFTADKEIDTEQRFLTTIIYNWKSTVQNATGSS
jgi:hypothetical protein